MYESCNIWCTFVFKMLSQFLIYCYTLEAFKNAMHQAILYFIVFGLWNLSGLHFQPPFNKIYWNYKTTDKICYGSKCILIVICQTIFDHTKLEIEWYFALEFQSCQILYFKLSFVIQTFYVWLPCLLFSDHCIPMCSCVQLSQWPFNWNVKWS